MKIPPAPALEYWPAFKDRRPPAFPAGIPVSKRDELRGAVRLRWSSKAAFDDRPAARVVQRHSGAGGDFDVDFPARLDSSNPQVSVVFKESVVVSFFAIRVSK